MACEFGFNCRHYLPSLRKCRKLIDNYRVRKDLVEEKWLGIRDVLVYLSLSNDALIRSVASGEIKAKRQKDGELTLAYQSLRNTTTASLPTPGACVSITRHTTERRSRAWMTSNMWALNTRIRKMFPLNRTSNLLKMPSAK